MSHRFEDGGGRELAYVSMSRARQTSTVHVVADSLEQAVEDLTRDWAVEHRVRWAIDSGTPATEPLAVEHQPNAPSGMRAALRHARLQAERQAIAAAIPPDPSVELADVDRRLAELRRDRTHLLTGHGRYAGTPEGDAARHLIRARQQHTDARHNVDTSTSWRDRRHWRKKTAHWADRESAAEASYADTVGPEANRLDAAIGHLEEHRDELHAARRKSSAWLAEHPEASRRLHSLDQELHPLSDLPPEIQKLGRAKALHHRRDPGIQRPGPDHGISLDFGP